MKLTDYEIETIILVCHQKCNCGDCESWLDDKKDCKWELENNNTPNEFLIPNVEGFKKSLLKRKLDKI